ncbi:hypothetical protein GE09DRAFT_732521 [Coniochaeta sp. 2T2.1]|nr:hypothetical protein GE09DRAFT_732521 [Coniochaeta sp. 2T2.1]
MSFTLSPNTLITAVSFPSARFDASLGPLALASREATSDHYLEVDQSPRHQDKLACFRCFRLLPKSSVGHGHSRGRRGKNGTRPELRGTRFCWECATKHRLYPELRAVKKDGMWWYLCHRCGVYKLRSEICERAYCSPRSPTAGNSVFEEFPLRLQKQIFRLLDYRDAIRLAQTSHHFHAALHPAEDAPIQSRYLFVRILERPHLFAPRGDGAVSPASRSSLGTSSPRKHDTLTPGGELG